MSQNKTKGILPPKKTLQVRKMMLQYCAEIQKFSPVFSSFTHSLYDLDSFHDDRGTQCDAHGVSVQSLLYI